jgi:hypothetical protein
MEKNMKEKELVFRCPNQRCKTRFYESAKKLFEKYDAPCYCGTPMKRFEIANSPSDDIICDITEATAYLNLIS